jgi:Flp pilus assembly protein TadG
MTRSRLAAYAALAMASIDAAAPSSAMRPKKIDGAPKMLATITDGLDEGSYSGPIASKTDSAAKKAASSKVASDPAGSHAKAKIAARAAESANNGT